MFKYCDVFVLAAVKASTRPSSSEFNGIIYPRFCLCVLCSGDKETSIPYKFAQYNVHGIE